MSDARDTVLARVRAALADRDPTDHPGVFGGWRPGNRAAGARSAVEAFSERFRAAGGEVARLADLDAARSWLGGIANGLAGAVCGATVPSALCPALPALRHEDAPLGVSMALGAVAETGTVVLDARDGRRCQLLPPSHVMWVPEAHVHATLLGFLEGLEAPLSSALGLHSGPSKSADIGQILVRGVHGPGRVFVGILGFDIGPADVTG